MKNIKSLSLVEVNVDGAEAVKAVNYDVLEFTKLPVCTKHFLK